MLRHTACIIAACSRGRLISGKLPGTQEVHFSPTFMVLRSLRNAKRYRVAESPLLQVTLPIPRTWCRLPLLWPTDAALFTHVPAVTCAVMNAGCLRNDVDCFVSYRCSAAPCVCCNH